MRILFSLILLLPCLLLSAQGVVSIPGSNGNNIALNVHVPAGKWPCPCIIIAPGRGYHKDLPIIKDLAEQAAKKGFVAIRFDWGYWSQKGGVPSADLSNEITDMEAVLHYAKKLNSVDSTQIMVGGKSLGSVVAFQLYLQHPDLKGVLLQTPIIPKADQGESYYPNLGQQTRPIIIELGVNDKENCPLQELYGFLKNAKQAIPVIVAGGEHSLEIAPRDKPENEAINLQNIQQANQMAVWWLQSAIRNISTTTKK